jgi:hypothetical protein
MEDWQLVLLTAGVTTLGTVLVTYIGHRMTVSRDTQEERDRHGTYVATRVVCMLGPICAASTWSTTMVHMSRRN